MRMENELIRIRGFDESDLPLMLKWLTDDKALEYCEERDVSKIHNGYFGSSFSCGNPRRFQNDYRIRRSTCWI